MYPGASDTPPESAPLRFFLNLFFYFTANCWALLLDALCDVHSYYWNAQVCCRLTAPHLQCHDVMGATGSLTVHLVVLLKDKKVSPVVDNF